MHYNAPHPTKHHTLDALPSPAASAFLARYLSAAATDAALRPDAEPGPAGPAAPAGELGLVLQNLRRVERGVNGEVLIEEEAAEGTCPVEGMGMNGGDPGTSGRQVDGAADAEGEGQWMDKGDFERMQEDVLETGGAEEGVEGTRELGGARLVDREVRKKLKKERRKKERREMAMQHEGGEGD